MVHSLSAEESICLMGTPPRVARRRSIMNPRRISTTVSEAIREEEYAKPVDLLFSIDGAVNEEQVREKMSKFHVSNIFYQPASSHSYSLYNV